MECMQRDDWRESTRLSHSAPATFFYTGCRRAASFPFVGEKDLTPPSALKVRSQSESEGLNKFYTSPMTIEQFKEKIRSLPKTQEEESGCETDSDTLSNSGSSTDLAPDIDDMIISDRKKSVRFADDCGRELFCIRVMTEPSDYPPRIPSAVLRKLRGEDYDGEDDEHKRVSATWMLSFPQPASEYMKFREKLETNKVSLENIVLKNDIGHMTGTIKVSNISYEKRVFIRWTANAWSSYMDRPAVYQPSSSKVYDTFTFDVEIPADTSKESRIEFCVCFVAGTDEYWDSNDGKNYVLISQHVDPHSQHNHHHHLSGFRELDREDAYKQNYTNWSTFASWKNLSTEGPYW